MNTAFRPTLTAFEDRLNLSADPLPILMIISDGPSMGPEHEIEYDLVAGPAAGRGRGEWINVASANIGGHKPLNIPHDDVWVDGRVITAENPSSVNRHSDFLWLPVGRNEVDGRDFVIWRKNLGATPPATAAAGSDLTAWQQNFGEGASAADRDIVIKGQTIGENARRQHGAVTILKEWDANVPHTVGANETITIHGSRTE